MHDLWSSDIICSEGKEDIPDGNRKDELEFRADRVEVDCKYLSEFEQSRNSVTSDTEKGPEDSEIQVISKSLT